MNTCTIIVRAMRAVILGFSLAIFIVSCGGEDAATQEEAATPEQRAALIDPKRIDATLSGFVARDELIGISALVFEAGEEAYFGAFGLADREAERSMDRDTLVQIFSMTKPITGVVLMTLYEEGLFNLDDPLEKHLPEYAGIQVGVGEEDGDVLLVDPVRKPTIRDILRHTAGFASGNPSDTSLIGDRYREISPTDSGNTLAQMSVKLATIPLFYQPGTRWFYGPSVDVQARLVEVLSGQTYANVLQERLLDPLGMNDTQYTLRPEQRARLTALYERQSGGSFTRIPDEQALMTHLQDVPFTPGGSGLTSTLDDYMRFARMLLNEGELDGVRVLKPETVRLMATDAMPAEVTDTWWLGSKGQVGFGIDFAVRTAPPIDQAEASGAVGEFFWDGAANTLFWVDPENDITAVLFNFYRPFGNVSMHKDFRDAIYFSDEAANALNKAAPVADQE